MVYLGGGDEGGADLLWPKPPEIPRYRYVGDLVGELNFVSSDKQARDRKGGFWRWLTGVSGHEEERLVLQRPQGVVTDAQGRVFVTDVSRQAVFVFDAPAGNLRLIEFADEGRRFVSPVGIALNSAGELLVTDAELDAVFRFSPDGRPVGSFGDGVLERPTGIAINPETGRIYVADTAASNIKVFNRDGQLTDTLGYAGDRRGRLNRPVYLAFSAGRLYVSDALNSRVQVFGVEGEALMEVGKRGLFIGNLTRPKGVAVDDEGDIYVIEGFYDHLLVFNRDGEFLMAFGGSGSRPGEFYLPTGVWINSSNRVFVADMFNGRVSVFQFLGAEQ